MEEKISNPRVRILKWFIYSIGGICLVLFLSIRVLPVLNFMLTEKLTPGYWDKTKYGENYYFSHINTFKEPGLPPSITKFQFDVVQATPEEAEILIFGDSFFDISRGTQFPRLLAEKTGHKIHYVYQELPLEYLARINYNDTTEKTLILGLVERYIPLKSEMILKDTFYTDRRPAYKKTLSDILDQIFYKRSEEFYDVLLKRSYVTTDMYSSIAMIKFKLFGYISGLTPKYLADKDNAWLFYYDQVNDENTSFYYKFDVSEVEKMCKNINELSVQLKHKYNINLVFLPLPSQYTLYHGVINNDEYNNFLPMLFQGLKAFHIPHIEVYDDFTNSDQLLYYKTDGHWNVKGIDMAVSNTIDYLRREQDSPI